jgi:hypothetical protein
LLFKYYCFLVIFVRIVFFDWGTHNRRMMHSIKLTDTRRSPYKTASPPFWPPASPGSSKIKIWWGGYIVSINTLISSYTQVSLPFLTPLSPGVRKPKWGLWRHFEDFEYFLGLPGPCEDLCEELLRNFLGPFEDIFRTLWAI